MILYSLNLDRSLKPTSTTSASLFKSTWMCFYLLFGTLLDTNIQDVTHTHTHTHTHTTVYLPSSRQIDFGPVDQHMILSSNQRHDGANAFKNIKTIGLWANIINWKKTWTKLLQRNIMVRIMWCRIEVDCIEIYGRGWLLWAIN
jgi:hypothetical protein